MDLPAIFGLQFTLSLVAWSLTIALTIGPWLRRLPRREALLYLSLPHAFRHVGMVFLVPGVVDQPLPTDFSMAAAYGDLASGLLALLAVLALHRSWRPAFGLAWLLHLVGSIDLLNALSHSGITPLMGATWYIPTMLVPLLLVTHAMSFKRLLTRDRSQAPLQRVSCSPAQP